jgi:hypothetical protein
MKYKPLQTRSKLIRGAQGRWISRELKDRRQRQEVDVLENRCIRAFGIREPNVIERNRAHELEDRTPPVSSVLVSSFSSLLKSFVACTDFEIRWAVKEFQ